MIGGRFLAAALGLLGLVAPASAQNNFPTPGGATADGAVAMCLNGSNQAVPCSATNPLAVNATVTATASISGFRPVAYGTPIAVTTAGVTGGLPSNTGQVVATNVGTTNGAYCALGASSSTSAQYIAPNGGWFGFAISGDTQLTCITATGTTTVNTAGGSGLPTGTGGGGGGGGSGGSVTQGTTPWIIAGQGTAGSAAAAVETVQGIAGMTPVQVAQATAANLNATVTQAGAWTVNPTTIGNWGLQVSTQNSATPTNGGLVLGQFNTAPTGIANGNVSPLQVDTNGNLLVNVKAGGAGGGAVTIVDGGSVTLGAKADAATCATTNSEMACLRQIDADVKGSIPSGSNVISLGDAALGSTVDPLCTLPASTTACTIEALLKTLNNTASFPAQITSLTAAARHFPGCTVGTSSGTCLAASTALVFVQGQNTSATAQIACRADGGTAALNSAGSFQLGPGVPFNWGPMTGGVPTGAINCIASAASTPLYLEWN